MNTLLAAAVLTDEELREAALRARPNWGTDDFWILLLVLLTVAALLFAGVRIFRKPGRHRRAIIHPGPAVGAGRRRRRRREHRSRNPTLAETGGLPPRRPLDPSPPGI